MLKYLKSVICLPVLAFLAWQTLSAGDLAAQSIETREVTVTSTRTERDLFVVPMTVTVKSAEDLKWQPNTNVADFLADVPGVQIMDGGMPGGKRVMIRGESPMRSLILVDGVKISEQKSMSGSAILIDTSQIERIEVIKGPASVLYGSEAIGGVINIITKKGGDKPIGFSQNLIADSSTSSLEWQTAIFGEYNGFNYRVTGSGINAGDRMTPLGELERSSYRNNYFSVRLGYDWDGGSVYVKADDYRSVIRIPVNYGSAVGLTGMTTTTAVDLFLPQWDRKSVSAGFELRDLLPNLAKVSLNLYYQNMIKYFQNLVTVRPPMPPGMYINTKIHTTNDQDSFGGSLQTDWKLGDHYLIVGLDYNKDDLTADDRRPSVMSYPGPALTVPVAYRYKADQSVFGLFAQDEWTLPHGFTATLGLRNTWVNSKLRANDNPNLPNNSAKNDSRLVGNVGLVWKGLENLSLRATWSQGYKFPPLNDLYLGTVHGSGTPTYPNPNLKPETSDNFEVGMRYNNGALNLDLAIFYALSKNYITTRPMIGVPNASQFVNTDQARTIGFELGVSYEIYSLGLTPYATVTYLNREFTDTQRARKGNNYFDVKFTTSDTGTPPWSGRLGFKFDRDLDNGLIFHANAYMEWASLAKETYYDSSSAQLIALNTWQYDWRTDEYPGWQTYNVDLGMEWGEEHKWNASVSLRNISNRAYTRANNAIMDPGFHVVAGVGFEF
ncbi:MAG: TonB-dependent receptor [Deltaproteobacteria bacterium]|jgi:hemoglobin/transferrin/lactoferrin receptor protein|nr:TonB-dependent receptor [Deltaproteobacteria bacterium]